MASNQSRIEELAKSIGLPKKSTKQVLAYLEHDILLSLYRDPEQIENDRSPLHADRERHLAMNAKIEALYKKEYGRPFNYKIHSKNKRLPLFLLGIPGQGKTAVYIAAAKNQCAKLNLNFISHVTDDYVPRSDDFIMVVQECAGENSAITFGGVPKAETINLPGGGTRSVLKKALNYRFTVFEHVAGGVLLFDDAANAPSVIQNVLLPVAQNGTFQGMHIPNACIGFTGNLGALDGTHVTELSTALLTRVIPMFVTDTLKDYLFRGYSQYNDELGDLGYFNYLQRNEDNFAALPEPGQKAGFSCSRSHDNFVQTVRSIVERNGGRAGLENSLDEIHTAAYSLLGRKAGNEIAGYYNSYIQGADPLAREFVKEGKVSEEKFREKYGNGAAAEQLSFGTQFASACADYAVILMTENNVESIKDKSFIEAVKSFGNAVLLLNDTEYTYSIDHFKNRLASQFTKFATTTKDSTYDLTSDVREVIAEVINSLPNCDSTKRKSLIASITDYDKIDNITRMGNTRAKKR